VSVTSLLLKYNMTQRDIICARSKASGLKFIQMIGIIVGCSILGLCACILMGMLVRRHAMRQIVPKAPAQARHVTHIDRATSDQVYSTEISKGYMMGSLGYVPSKHDSLLATTTHGESTKQAIGFHGNLSRRELAQAHGITTGKYELAAEVVADLVRAGGVTGKNISSELLFTSSLPEGAKVVQLPEKKQQSLPEPLHNRVSSSFYQVHMEDQAGYHAPKHDVALAGAGVTFDPGPKFGVLQQRPMGARLRLIQRQTDKLMSSASLEQEHVDEQVCTVVADIAREKKKMQRVKAEVELGEIQRLIASGQGNILQNVARLALAEDALRVIDAAEEEGRILRCSRGIAGGAPGELYGRGEGHVKDAKGYKDLAPLLFVDGLRSPNTKFERLGSPNPIEISGPPQIASQEQNASELLTTADSSVIDVPGSSESVGSSMFSPRSPASFQVNRTKASVSKKKVVSELVQKAFG
jgi:hypothetical protein